MEEQWGNADLRETKQIIYQSKGIDESYPKIVSKVVQTFVKVLAFFTMRAHQIRSYHVTQESNFEIFYFVPILHLILGNVTKFLVEKLST